MKRLIPDFSDWFAAWISAGQFSSVEELELDTDVLPSNKIRLFPAPLKFADRDHQSGRPKKVRWG